MLSDEVQSHTVLSTSGNYHIGVLLCGDAELLKCRFDEAGVLVEDMLQVPASLRDVPQDSPVTQGDIKVNSLGQYFYLASLVSASVSTNSLRLNFSLMPGK